MMRAGGRSLCVLWLLLAMMVPVTASAQEVSAPSISVLTFSPGEIYWQRFGHNALLVRESGRAVVYNYGIFDFQQENFLLNFARGRMQYRLAEESFSRTLALYRQEGRGVIEQQLDLEPSQARALRDFLAWNAQPENAEYRYDYFLSNCSTRLRDAINDALDGQLRVQLEMRPGLQTYRQQVVRLTAPDLPLMLGLDAVLGPSADRPASLWAESFVPMVLQSALREATRIGADGTRVPLVRAEHQWVVPQIAEPAEQPPHLWPAFFGLGLLLGALLAALGARRNALPRAIFASLAVLLLVLAFLVGGVMLAFWGLTEHWAGWRNLSLLVFNPVALMALPGVIAVARRRAPSARARGFAAVLLGAALLGLLMAAFQHNLHWVLFWLPIHAGIAWHVLRWR